MATCDDTVLHFMRTQNRPFSLTNIVDALQSTGYKKSQVSRSLDSLVESGRLQSVNEGKVYLAVQSDEAVDDTEVARLEAEAKAMAAQVGELKKRAAELSSVVRACGAVQSTEQLVAGAAQLEGEIASLEARLAPLRDGGAVVIKPEEVDAAEMLALEVYGVWASRRKSFRELWDAVCEATDTAPKVLKVDVPYDEDDPAAASAMKDAVAQVKAARFKAGRK